MTKEASISGNELRSQTARTLAALPAAGAWDASPIELECPNFVSATFYCVYDEDAATVDGAVTFMIEVSPYAADISGVSWFNATAYAVGSIASGSDVLSLLQANTISFEPTGATAEGFVFTIDLDSTVLRIRLVAQESGDVANPGEFGAHVIFG